jgi:molecular chaperone GrpE
MTPRRDDILEDETDTKEQNPNAGADERAETGVEPVDTGCDPAEHQALRRERDELRDQLLRRRADFENYRKRVERDREQAAIDAKAGVLSGLLPILDNFERALGVPTSDAGFREGVELIHRNFLTYLEQQGVVAKDPTGERFDPQQHQALMHEPAPGFEDGTIVETFRKAYFFKDRLLRPALVKVAKGASGDGDPETKH